MRLASFGEIEADDAEARRAVGDAVAALSFVADATAPVTVWPDGLTLEVRLRRPVACVRVPGAFLLVADDGTLLSGDWNVPPRVHGRWLPVIGPPDRVFHVASAGMRLAETQDLDALDVALSLEAHLPERSSELLGRIAIDASRGPVADVDEPGVRLLLEDERLVLFGRPPRMVEPGELPVEAKWASLVRALDLLASGSLDWDLVDVRWDDPELRPRGRVPGADDAGGDGG